MHKHLLPYTLFIIIHNMDRIEVAAYAKVNFILDMVGKRADGYHELESIMQAIELHDDVYAEWEDDPKASGFKIFLDPGHKDLPADDKNLAFRAALKMKEAFRPNARGRLNVKIAKRIPLAAGLAGGSADGAAVCTALGRFWNISVEDWLPVSAALGADVPFCAWAQNGRPAALARGTGTVLTAVEPLNCKLLLVNPGYPVSTKEVYSAFDSSPKGIALAAKPHSEGRCAAWTAAKTINEKLQFMNNDLQPVTLALRPQLAEIFSQLQNLQPAPLAVQLSGSGPTVFAVYPPDAEPPEGHPSYKSLTPPIPAGIR